MSDRKELIRDMINAIINSETDKASEVFTQISYDVSREKLGLGAEPEPEVTEVEENKTSDPDDTTQTTAAE
jgi:hypothetical protein